MSRHRKPPRRGILAAAVVAPAAATAALAFAATAAASPVTTHPTTQRTPASDAASGLPGVTSPDDATSPDEGLPGVTDAQPTPPPAPQPAPSPAPEQAPPSDYAAPPISYPVAPVVTQQPDDDAPANAPQADTEDATYTPAPTNTGQLHAPQPVRPVAPKLPPKGKLRVGSYQTDNPGLPDPVLNLVNIDSAVVSANLNNAFNSVGIKQGDSARIASTTVATTAAGAIGGATVAGVPMALIGAGIGAGVGAGVGTEMPLIGTVPGAGAGAAIGAAALGLPSAAAGAVAGGTGGALVGLAFGAANPAQDTNELPELPKPHTPAAPAPAPSAPQTDTDTRPITGISGHLDVNDGHSDSSTDVSAQATSPDVTTISAHTTAGGDRTWTATVDASAVHQAANNAAAAIAAQPGAKQALDTANTAGNQLRQAAVKLLPTGGVGPVRLILGPTTVQAAGTVAH